MLRIFLLLWFFLTPSISFAFDAEIAEIIDANTKVSSILFPETIDWAQVNKMKRANKEFIQKNLKKLAEASPAGESENKFCANDGEKILFDEDNFGHADFLYIHDMNADGKKDVIYSGPAPCAEGNTTLVWIRNETGFVLDKIAEGMLVLRVKEGTPLQFSSVVVGCCADFVDRYFVGTSRIPRERGFNMTKTTMPPKKTVEPYSFVSKKEMVLRRSPGIDDAYDETASMVNNVAVFGNVLSKYLPGCAGTVIGSHQNPKTGTLWNFVELNECGMLRTHSPFHVDAGWVEAADTK